ncbi:MAG: PGPGW domain-containing protein [Desulfobacterales bacterium]
MPMVQWSEVSVLLNTHQILLRWLGLLSLFTFCGTLIAVPLLVVRLPRDYLSAAQGVDPESYGIWWWPLQVFKNVLGMVLIGAGVAMLVLPGQGLLTIFIGLSLVTFPGKPKVLRKLVRQKSIMQAINWLRKKWKVAPLEMPSDD